jgi:hypothetical protein
MANDFMDLFSQGQGSAQEAAASPVREARTDVAPAPIDSVEARRGFRKALDTGDLETSNKYIAAGIMQYLRPDQQRLAMQMVRQIETQRQRFGPKGLEIFRQQGITPAESLERGLPRTGVTYAPTPEPGITKPGKPESVRSEAEREYKSQVGTYEYLKQTGVIKEPKDDFEQKREKAVSLAERGRGREIRRIAAKKEAGEALTEEERGFERQQAGYKEQKEAKPAKEERLTDRLLGSTVEAREAYFERKNDLTKEQARDENILFEIEHGLRSLEEKEITTEPGGVEATLGAALPGATPTQLPGALPEGVATRGIPGAGAETPSLTTEIAQQILQEAGGDKERAREIARQRGYQF